MTDGEARYEELLDASLPPVGHPNRDEWREYALRGPTRLRPHVERLVTAMGGSGRLLDLGSGDGASCSVANPATVAVTMVDVQAEALRRARARDGGDQVVRGDGSTLPFADQTFDGALLNDVVEHLEDPVRVLREVHRVLRPGALVRLLTVHPYALRNVRTDPHWGLFGLTLLPRVLARPYVEEARRRGTSYDVHRMFTRRALESLVRACGFDTIDTARPWTVPPTVVVLDAVRRG